jgi:putative flippase GtrA
MLTILLIPFAMQAILIVFDEWVFHLKRGLPKWERIGHPLDTLTVLATLCYALLIPCTIATLWGYVALAIFSCLFITKDEFVHKQHCPASEQWVHALLFINHPFLLAAVGMIWVCLSSETPPSWLAFSVNKKIMLHQLLIGQLLFVCLFMCYQIVYWNFIWKEKKQK